MCNAQGIDDALRILDQDLVRCNALRHASIPCQKRASDGVLNELEHDTIYKKQSQTYQNMQRDAQKAFWTPTGTGMIPKEY